MSDEDKAIATHLETAAAALAIYVKDVLDQYGKMMGVPDELVYDLKVLALKHAARILE